MELSTTTDKIRQIGSPERFLTPLEKHRLVELVEEVSRNGGLGLALTALWEQQKAIGFILGTPTDDENTDDPSKFLVKKIGRFCLVHSPARQNRANEEFLKEHKILARDAKYIYEKHSDQCYTHYPLRRQGHDSKCFLCSAERANPNEVLIPIELADCEFLYGANYATLGYSHFTVWSKIPILQKYWPRDVLLWLCEHGRRLASAEFTTFFNGLGAGNSINHFHYQTLREVFPIFDVSPTLELQGVARLDWPMPAYRIVTELDQQAVALSRMDQFICAWLDMDRSHSLNLIHMADSQGKAHVVFLPRINVPEKLHPAGISNGFAGCEVSGRINVESLDEWNWAAKQSESTVAELIRSIAPPEERIHALQESL